MDLEYDEAKDRLNVIKHKISLARAADFDPLAIQLDERADYGETRYRSWGLLDNEAYFLAFTLREGRYRAISLRRAHRKEWVRYVSE